MGPILSRRDFFSVGVSTCAVLAGCDRSSPRDAGKVFLDYDEAGLDAAYDQRNWASNIREVYDRIDAQSAAVLSRLGSPSRHLYGASPIEGLDWYATSVENAPVHIHIHGGGWGAGEARRNAFMAATFVDTSVHFVVPDYIKVQDVGGRLGPLAEDVCQAIAWVYQNAESLGGNRNQIYLSGHSAGGHLAGVALVTDWARYGVPQTIVKKALCVSGMYDLLPVSLSSRNEYVKFTAGDIEALSPIRHLDRLRAEVIVAYGTNESPEFQRQSVAFAEAIADAGRSVSTVVGESLNHFEILETFGDPQGLMGRTAIGQIE